MLDKRDLLLIDLRGTGRSAAIDCPDLQHGVGDWDAPRSCGEQLGASASLYGSADRAEDIEDVRAALGIPKLDYYGLSSGGLQVQAYARVTASACVPRCSTRCTAPASTTPSSRRWRRARALGRAHLRALAELPMRPTATRAGR